VKKSRAASNGGGTACVVVTKGHLVVDPEDEQRAQPYEPPETSPENRGRAKREGDDSKANGETEGRRPR